MRRKDCEHRDWDGMRWSVRRSEQVWRAVALITLLTGGPASDARAGNVRLWPSAVVVGDKIRLDDLCELRGFDAETEHTLARLTVAPSPPPGGSLRPKEDTACWMSRE